MAVTCSTNGGDVRVKKKNKPENLIGRHNLLDLGVDGKITMKWS